MHRNHLLIFYPQISFSFFSSVLETGKIYELGLSFLKKMTRNASEHRDIPFETLLKNYIKVLNFALLKSIAKVICLKAVSSADAKVARQADHTTLRAVNQLVLIMSEEHHVSAHNLLPDM